MCTRALNGGDAGEKDLLMRVRAGKIREGENPDEKDANDAEIAVMLEEEFSAAKQASPALL